MDTSADFRKAADRTYFRFALLALTILASVVFMGKAYQQSLQAMDSSVHARLALDITSRGIRPVLPIRSLDGGHDLTSFNDHPFTLFYLVGWLMRALGPDAWSARLLPSLFAVGCIPLTVWLSSLLSGPVIGLAAGFVLTFSLPFISFGARFQLDHAMIFFILLSFIGWQKRSLWWTGLAAGLGLWMKNQVAFLIFPSAFLALVMTRRLSRSELVFLLKAGIIALLAGTSVWVLEGELGGWEVVSDYWRRQVLGTAVGGRGYGQVFDPFLFTEALRRRYWPWLPLLLASLVWILRKRAWKKPEVALPLATVLVVVLVISSMRFKFDHYYFPMYPFVAMLTILCIQPWLNRRRLGVMKFIIGAGLVLPGFLLAMPVELSPEMFPALRKFEAIIQSYGSCTDKVLWVEGGQPYGGFNDYDAELGFYTNRPTLEATCEQAPGAINAQKPQWIILSSQSRSTCIPKTLLEPYGKAFRFGNQLLLSRSPLIPVSEDTDLTPLARELQAPRDCEASPLPKNRYYR